MPIFTSCITRYDSSAFRALRRLIFCVYLSTFVSAQQPPEAPPEATEDRPEKPFPRTNKQIDDLLKYDHEKNLQDLERMARLVEEVQEGARKSTHHVISLQNLKKLEQIERLSRSIRGRMKRY